MNRNFSGKRNRYYGKQFAIVGDSISTLAGYNPAGYRVFYMAENFGKSGVAQLSDTWWYNVISYFGGRLLINNSWSGSRVTKLPGNVGLFPSGCSDERTSALHIGHIRPDVIIVYLGTNDWASGVKLGNGSEISGKDRNEFFRYAYDNMLKKLILNYPDSEIWCCTLSQTYISKDPGFIFPCSYAGIHIEEYNEIIRELVQKNRCHLLDLYAYRTPYDSIDGIHPVRSGMRLIAKMVIRSMTDTEGIENI